tara:strand:- start:461 stop:652 length:192 start_codon:yes stop_codon:yes gene_type:complete
MLLLQEAVAVVLTVVAVEEQEVFGLERVSQLVREQIMLLRLVQVERHKVLLVVHLVWQVLILQ